MKKHRWVYFQKTDHGTTEVGIDIPFVVAFGLLLLLAVAACYILRFIV